MNSVALTGNLTKDPEIKESKEGKAYGTLGLAVDNKRFSKEADTLYFDLKVFGQNAQFADKYLKKGRKIAILGHLDYDSVKNEETGKTIRYGKVIVDQLEPLDSAKKDADDDFADD